MVHNHLRIDFDSPTPMDAKDQVEELISQGKTLAYEYSQEIYELCAILVKERCAEYC